jgi:cell wall-associated NlpC family hydrolase
MSQRARGRHRADRPTTRSTSLLTSLLTPRTPAAPARRLLVVAGLTAALGIPVAATPAAAQPVSASVSASAPTLRQGSHGGAVVTLQRLLHVSADGAFGPLTRRAVIRFQRSAHLAPDGVVGPRTWRALRSRPGATAPHRTPRVSRSTTRTGLGARAVAEAARHVGQPYVYGANGPRAFDCSGFVQYVFSRVGLSLPRTSAAQAAVARPVAQRDRRPGDLIMMAPRGRVSHVGIYAGGNTMWVARHTGTTITRQRLWTTRYTVGRFS